MDEYRLSKYTHIVNHDEKTIFFNCYHGTKSIVELNLNTDPLNLTQLNNKDFILLQQKGHLVKCDLNENILIYELYKKYQNIKSLSLTILPNENCNFRCEYCYETLKKKQMDEKTIEAIISYVEENIYKYSSLNVAWYGGEPLLSMNIITRLSQRFIEICKEHKKLYFASITTNGYYLDLDTFRKLKKCNIFSYQITLDGYRESHDKQRPLYNGRGTYDVIFNNLIEIKKNIKSRMFKIILRTNCSKSNLKNFDMYVNDLLRYFSDDKRFEILLRPVMNWGGTRIDKIKNDLIDISTINEFIKILLEQDRKGQLSYYTGLLEPTGSVCYAGYKNHLTINSTGEIFKCTCDLNNNMNSKIGKINENSKIMIDQKNSNKWCTDIKFKKFECNNCCFAPICLFDYCPGKRNFERTLSLPCPFEKYFLDSLLVLLSKRKKEI